jgi:hypothetical protein
MKKGMSIYLSVLLAIFGMLLIFDGNDADAAPIHWFAGKWACSSYLAEAPFGGGVAGIAKTEISLSGVVNSMGYAVVGLPGVTDLFLKSTSEGKVTEIDYDFITMETLLRYEGGEDIIVRIKCIGMEKGAKGGYEEMRCLDLTVEPVETAETVTNTQCKRMYPGY